jgi:RNA polymerase sigma-70 factor (ECF subfamily)
VIAATRPVEPALKGDRTEGPAPSGSNALDPSPQAAARSGPPDDGSFARLFAEHAAVVARVLRRMGVPDADLEDVTQEVFVVVYQRWQEFRGDSSLRTWVYGIALRKAMSHRRRKHVRDSLPLREEHLSSVAPGQQRALERGEQRQLLSTLLGKLDDKKREVFVLYELEHVEMQDIARLVDAPLHTCYSRLRAARDELKRQLQRLSHKEGLP